MNDVLERNRLLKTGLKSISMGRAIRHGLVRLRAIGKRITGASDETQQRVLSPQPKPGTGYGWWIAAYDTLSDSDRAVIRAHIPTLPFHPLISVIMPVGRIGEAALHDSLNSVTTQLYPWWELCISVDAISGGLLHKAFRHSIARNSRIKFTGIGNIEDTANANNAALSLATGEFVAFLRAGDILPEHALYQIALELVANQSTDIVYSDRDEIDVNSNRVNPWFKPGWDPDLLLAEDYINDLVVFRRNLVEAIGGLRHNFEGAEFHDLALRATAMANPDGISHLPSILYHKRADNGVVHSRGLLSSRAIAASRRAVRDHLNSRGYTDALLKPAPQLPSATRVIWHVPEPLPLVSVIIPTRDRADLLGQCVDGVRHRTDYSNLELLIVDNGSTEPATHALFDRLTREDSRVRILHCPGPFNYAALNNAAAREAKGEILLLLNNDIDVIESGWLREMISQAVRLDVGIVGAKLLYASERIQHAGVALGPDGEMHHLYTLASKNDPGYFGQLALARTLSAVTGACAAIRRSVFWEVGGLDEVNLAVAFNDIDLCLRLGDRGYRVVWTPFAELFHFESSSRGRNDSAAKQALFVREWQYMQKTWGSLLESGDPFHNPNLLFAVGRIEIPSSPRREKPWRRLRRIADSQ